MRSFAGMYVVARIVEPSLHDITLARRGGRPDPGPCVVAIAESYSSYGGRETSLRTNLLGEPCAPESKAPRAWKTRETAEKHLHRSGQSVMRLGYTNAEIRAHAIRAIEYETVAVDLLRKMVEDGAAIAADGMRKQPIVDPVVAARELRSERELATVAAIRAGIRGDREEVEEAVERCQELGLM